MSTLVEVSTDQTDWVPYDRTKTRIEDYHFIRTIDTVDKRWSRVQISAWLNEKLRLDGTRIEYSMDDGFSYQILRTNKGAPEDAARIFTLVQNTRYVVRSVTQVENNNYIPPMTSITSTIFDIQKASGNQTVREKTEMRWVVFEPTGTFTIHNKRPNEFVCEVEQTIPMSLSIPNSNKVSLGRQVIPGDTVGALLSGHCYYLSPCITLPFEWKNVIRAHRKQDVNPADWFWVNSARTYDDETMGIGGNVFAMTVLSNKYYVDSLKQPHKIGSQWLIKTADAKRFADNVNAQGGFAVVQTAADAVLEVTYKQPEVLEKIMTVQAELQRAIESHDPDLLAKEFFNAVEFRDQAIENLRVLNETIKKAREAAMHMIGEDNGSPA